MKGYVAYSFIYEKEFYFRSKENAEQFCQEHSGYDVAETECDFRDFVDYYPEALTEELTVQVNAIC